jgi:hypothetical protein
MEKEIGEALELELLDVAIGVSIGVSCRSSNTMKEKMNKIYLTRIIEPVRFYFGLI